MFHTAVFFCFMPFFMCLMIGFCLFSDTDTWQIPVVNIHSHLANCNTLASHDSLLSSRGQTLWLPMQWGLLMECTTSCLRPGQHQCFLLHSKGYFSVVVSSPGVSNKTYIPRQYDKDPDKSFRNYFQDTTLKITLITLIGLCGCQIKRSLINSQYYSRFRIAENTFIFQDLLAGKNGLA